MALVEIGVFLIALGLVIKGSDLVVDAGARIAKKLGVGDFLIGLTIIALGTSLPELAVVIPAAFQQKSDFIIGTIVGSNIANLAFVVGVASVFVTVRANKEIYSRDALLLLASSLLLFLFAFNGTIGVLEGIFFVILFALYLAYFIAVEKHFGAAFHIVPYAREVFDFKNMPALKPRYSYTPFSPGLDYYAYKELVRETLYQVRRVATISGDIVWDQSRIIQYVLFQFVLLAVGLVLLFVGSGTLVSSISAFPFPPFIVGGLVVALGTSLPELVVAITALRKGFSNIMIGNIIGSVIANTLLIGGIASIITTLVVSPALLWTSFSALVFISWMFVVFLRNDYEITRIEGLTLLAFYGGFVLYLLGYLI